MKKRLSYAAALLALVGLAAGVRQWQRATAFEPESGLLRPGMPATWALLAVIALAGAGFFLLARWMVQGVQFKGYLAAFSQPAPWAAIPYLVAGALLVAAGALGVMDYADPLSEKQVTGLILGALLVLTGASMVLVGVLGGRKEAGKGRFAGALLLPSYCACVWMIFAYQARATHPNAMGYVCILAGGVLAAIFCYVAASFSFERARPAAALWLGGMSLVLLAMAGVDFRLEGDNVSLFTATGYSFYILGQLVCLVTRCEVPAELIPWVPTQTPEAGETPEEGEVDEHE